MRGFVLAAGFGTRLKPLTDHLPKALVSVCGEPLLERVLTGFREAGFTDLAVNTHYLTEQIERFRAHSELDFQVFHERDAIRGTGGALDFARSFLEGDDAFAVWNVDIVSHLDFWAIGSQFLDSGAMGWLLAAPGEERATLLYSRENQRYAGTPRDTKVGPHLGGSEFIGIALYRKEFPRFVRPDDFSIVPVWKRAVHQGGDIRVFEVSPLYWKDAGNAHSLADIHFDVCAGRLSLTLPEWMTLDTAGRRAFHRGLAGFGSQLGALSWVETKEIPASCAFSKCVVYRDAVVGQSGGEIRDRILTAWGEIVL